MFNRWFENLPHWVFIEVSVMELTLFCVTGLLLGIIYRNKVHIVSEVCHLRRQHNTDEVTSDICRREIQRLSHKNLISVDRASNFRCYLGSRMASSSGIDMVLEYSIRDQGLLFYNLMAGRNPEPVQMTRQSSEVHLFQCRCI